MEEIELKFCPFCGHKKINISERNYQGIFQNVRIWCDMCGASVGGMTVEKASKKWNRRTEDEQRAD